MNARTNRTSGRYCGGNLVKGGVGDVKRFHLSRSLNHRCEELGHFWVSCAVVSLRVLGFIPQTDSERFRPPVADERDLVLEAFLLSKQGNDFPLQFLGKVGNSIGF